MRNEEKMKKTINYAKLTDIEICDLIINDGNEEAVLYLIYDRFADDIRYKAYSIFKTLEYLDDLTQILYIHLKSSDVDWQTLRSFRNDSKFRTWFIGSVVNNLFLSKRRLMIGVEKFHNLLVEADPDKPMPEPKPEPHKDERMVLVLEAITKLKNDEYRLVLLKELEGFNHEEIAKMIEEKRKRENKIVMYNKQVFVPNAHYVDMIKARAVKELKPIVEQIKNECYGN